MNTHAARQFAELERVREHLVQVEVQVQAIEGGSLTVDEATTRLLDTMRARVEASRSRLAYFTAPGGNPHLDSVAEMLAIVEILSDPAGFEKRVRRAFEQIVPKQAISRDARPAAIKPLQAKRRDLLLQEEREICRLENDGVAVVRRQGIDAERAAAMLEVWAAL